MKVDIDKEGCIGCGLCAEICDSVFKIGDDEKAYVVKQPDANEMELALEAADSCPVATIIIDK